jgi:regulation of enolase protein 1 (concanavalin A-like superfamily)
MKCVTIAAIVLSVLSVLRPGRSYASQLSMQAPSGPVCKVAFEDGFDSLTLKSEWTWFNPTRFASFTEDAAASSLRIQSSQTNLGLQPGLNTAPRLQHVFTATLFDMNTTLDFASMQHTAGAGLFLFLDTSNFIRLEQTQTGQGTSIVIARNIENRWSYDLVDTTSSRVELRLSRRLDVIESFWRIPGGNWNALPSTNVPWGHTLTGGLLLHTLYPATSATATFEEYKFCGHDTGLKSQLLPILLKRQFSGIRGRLLYGGKPLGWVAVELRRYRPAVNAPSELVTLAGSNSDGNFVFEYPDPLQPGWAYYIRFRNPSVTPNGLLYAFTSIDILTFTTQTDAVLPDIDLTDIPLGPPYDPEYIQDVATPLQFNWAQRAATDSYRFAIVDPAGDREFVSPPLGSRPFYGMQSRPAGFETAPTYYLWFVVVDTPAGTGVSFNSGAVSFTN